MIGRALAMAACTCGNCSEAPWLSLSVQTSLIQMPFSSAGSRATT
jgi:hypothetical protein